MKKNRSYLSRALLLLLVVLLMMPVSVSAASVKLNKKKLSLMKGKTSILVLMNRSDEVTWISSKKSVATVDQNGVVKAKKKGTATITAKSDGKKYTCKVTVKQPVTKVKLNQKKIRISIGKTYKLKATATPTSANNRKVSWSSSDKSVVTVSSSGQIKAVSAGTATITAKAKDGSGKKATCEVQVKTPVTSGAAAGSQTNASGSQPNASGQGSSSAEQNGQNTANTSSAKAKKLLNVLQKYSDQIKADKENGIKWGYSNSSSLAPSTWSKAYSNSRTKGITYCNCALLPRWALREVGVLGSGNFWGLDGGGIKYGGSAKTQAKTKAELMAACEIIPVYKTPNQLLKEGNLLPGDICTYVNYQHTNVYAGNGLFYDSGRSGAVGSYQGGTFIFDSFGPAATVNMSGTKIGHIIRFK